MLKNPAIKHIAIVLAGVSCIFIILLSASLWLKPPEWFAFDLKDNLSVSKPLITGILDAPAGKHGFLTAKDGRFLFQDGTPARFWGTNLCFSANFPSKKQAVLLADRISFLGFNAVRLHHMDSRFEPEGIFKDTCPRCKDPQKKRTGLLSKRQMDRLDYFIYQLKKRGIYVNINLLVARRFTLADGVKDAGALIKAAKPASLFDPHLIGLQKKFALGLLTHRNHYTGLPYNNDPALALIEITNENSIFFLEKEGLLLPALYLKELELRYEAFPKEKYSTPEEAKKAFFIQIERAYLYEMTAFLKKECGIKVPVTGIGGYTRKETLAASLSADFIDTHTYWDHPRFPGLRWNEDNFKMSGKSILQSNDLGIIGQIISRAPEGRPYTISEWNHCYPNKYAYETPVLLAYQAAKHGWDGVFQFALSHDLDFFSSKKWGIYSYFDIILNPQQSILMFPSALVFHHPEAYANAVFENGFFMLDSAFVKGAVGLIKNRTVSLPSFSFTSGQDGAVFISSLENKPIDASKRLLLVTVSEVKNTDSGWHKDRFKWGRAPTLLKKMDVSIYMPADKKIKVYALDEKGQRKRTIKTRKKGGRIYFSTKNTKTPWFEITRQ
ncbi:MAG TPA: hypothetical protein DCL35_03065 [Candidatus Omnitrophica bacterium]|nr:hypothetical protein [Candidatus Omnitrophota bacterium]